MNIPQRHALTHKNFEICIIMRPNKIGREVPIRVNLFLCFKETFFKHIYTLLLQYILFLQLNKQVSIIYKEFKYNQLNSK